MWGSRRSRHQSKFPSRPVVKTAVKPTVSVSMGNCNGADIHTWTCGECHTRAREDEGKSSLWKAHQHHVLVRSSGPRRRANTGVGFLVEKYKGFLKSLLAFVGYHFEIEQLRICYFKTIQLPLVREHQRVWVFIQTVQQKQQILVLNLLFLLSATKTEVSKYLYIFNYD